MSKLEDFSLEQLSIFIIACLGACGGCIAVLFKSRCDRIEMGCLKIHRQPLPPPDEEKQEKKPTPPIKSSNPPPLKP